MFPWLVNPATPFRLESIGELSAAANNYFQACAEQGLHPRVTGLALALGLPGPSSLTRLARRRPELKHLLSRCMTAVAYHYEDQINGGSSASAAVFMLKNIPDFDTQDKSSAGEIKYFRDRHEVMVNHNIPGVVDEEATRGAELSPAEAYMTLIRGKEIIDIEIVPVATEQEMREDRKGLEKVLKRIDDWDKT
jgi:hypothetical protein